MAPGVFWNEQNPVFSLELLIVNYSDRLTFLLLHKLNPLVICCWFHSFHIQGRKTDWGTEKRKSMSGCDPLCVPCNKRPIRDYLSDIVQPPCPLLWLENSRVKRGCSLQRQVSSDEKSFLPCYSDVSLLPQQHNWGCTEMQSLNNMA